MSLIEKIKRKKEFSSLPDSIVERAAKISGGEVKESRALLRKYFGVFLTNRVLKAKGSADEILKAHISSKKRDYEKFYGEIFLDAGKIGSIIDLGAGVNGFSYSYLQKELGSVNYLAIEAAGQLVKNMNNYFQDCGFEKAHALGGDLFNVSEILKILKKVGSGRASHAFLERTLGKKQKKLRIIFMFQIVDALENLEKDFSKKFILKISKECEKIVLSLPTESLSGRKNFVVQRKWMMDFLEDNFVIEKDFKMNGERIIIIRKKKEKI